MSALAESIDSRMPRHSRMRRARERPGASRQLRNVSFRELQKEATEQESSVAERGLDEEPCGAHSCPPGVTCSRELPAQRPLRPEHRWATRSSRSLGNRKPGAPDSHSPLPIRVRPWKRPSGRRSANGPICRAYTALSNFRSTSMRREEPRWPMLLGLSYLFLSRDVLKHGKFALNLL